MVVQDFDLKGITIFEPEDDAPVAARRSVPSGSDSRMLATAPMTARIEARFARCRAENRAALATYVMAGDPDPETSLGIMELLEQINKAGTTVLVATHDHHNVDVMCKRVVGLREGQVIRDENYGRYVPGEQDLLKDIRYDFPGIADAADTVLEIDLDGKSYRLTAYALAEAGMEGEIAPAVEVPPADKAGRTAMREFIDALLAVPETDYVDQPHAYEFESLRLYVKPAEIVETSEFPGEQPPITWPLDDLATAGTVIDNPSVDRCLVVHGDDLATVLPLLQGANQLSVFESESAFYSLIPRPLERSDAADGGPLVYRAVHRVELWRAGERPKLLQEIVEGDAGLAI